MTAAAPRPTSAPGQLAGEDTLGSWSERSGHRPEAKLALVRGHGVIAGEFFDTGKAGRWRGAGARELLGWSRSSLTLTGVGRDRDREYERAFYSSQYAAMAPLFEHYGVQLQMPETGGRVDYGRV